MSTIRSLRKRSSAALAAPVALVLALCAACGSSGGSSPATVTVTASASGSGSASAVTSATRSGSVSTSASASASPLPTSTTSLGGTCDSVLPIGTVDSAVGVAVVGKTAFIVDKPDSAAGQVERINCQYGIAPVKAGSKVTDTKVEVSISLYSTDQEAADRVAGTSSEWRGQGAVPHAVPVSGHAATILIGYGKPLLVVAAGPRTVAVTMTATVVPAARLDAALTAVAVKAMLGAGG